VFPEFERREGTFIFRVTVQKTIWRLIAIPSGATLDDLVGCVLKAMKFDDDHLYEFTYADRLGLRARIVHPAIDEGPWTNQVRVGALPLEPGQTMDLHYDFGDDWHFTVKLERIDPPDAKLKKPRILESHGKAPKQYTNDDWF
jgi:Plasmid pRiA4b ORF-3-like protein